MEEWADVRGRKREHAKYLSAFSHFLKELGHVLQDGEKKSILTGMVKTTRALLLAGATNSSAPPTDNCSTACGVLLCADLRVSPPEHFALCGSLPLGLVASPIPNNTGQKMKVLLISLVINKIYKQIFLLEEK